VTLAKVKALRPDVLVISGHEKGALTAISQIKALKVYVPILAICRPRHGPIVPGGISDRYGSYSASPA
jgi:hypothetical protein